MPNPNYHLRQTDTVADWVKGMPVPSLAELRETMPIPFPTYDIASMASNANNITLTTSASIQEPPMSTVPQAAGIPYDEQNPFLNFQRRIDSMRKMRDNWNTYGAKAPNRKARFWSHRVLQVLSRFNFAPQSVSASSDEGVAIFFKYENRRASIECFNTGEILGIISEDSGVPEVWYISPSQIGHSVGTIQTFLTNTK